MIDIKFAVLFTLNLGLSTLFSFLPSIEIWKVIFIFLFIFLFEFILLKDLNRCGVSLGIWAISFIYLEIIPKLFFDFYLVDLSILILSGWIYFGGGYRNYLTIPLIALFIIPCHERNGLSYFFSSILYYVNFHLLRIIKENKLDLPTPIRIIIYDDNLMIYLIFSSIWILFVSFKEFVLLSILLVLLLIYIVGSDYYRGSTTATTTTTATATSARSTRRIIGKHTRSGVLVVDHKLLTAVTRQENKDNDNTTITVDQDDLDKLEEYV